MVAPDFEAVLHPEMVQENNLQMVVETAGFPVDCPMNQPSERYDMIPGLGMEIQPLIHCWVHF